MIDRFLSYFECVCPELFRQSLNDELVEDLSKQKSLLTVATLPLGIEVPQKLCEYVDSEIRRIHRLRALGHQLSELTDGAVKIIKGSKFASLYPSGVFRFQGDLDLLVTTEAAYVQSARQLLDLGFVQKSSHVTQARDGGLYASTIFFEPQEGTSSGPDSLFVEVHLRGFPMTPLSYLNMTADRFTRLSEDGQCALTLIAEIAHRFAKFNRFTHRDVLDSLLIFSRLTNNDTADLVEAITENSLWISVALLGRHLRQINLPSLPASLLTLVTDSRASTAPETYNLFEHQAWPFCQKAGMSREEYEYIHKAYGEINPASGQQLELTAFEVGMRFSRGVPIAMRVGANPNAATIFDACSLLAGPLEARTIVHERIGGYPPSRPQ